MRFLWKYLRQYAPRISGVMGIKMAGTVLELMIPYVMEHLIDHVVPTRQIQSVLIWGAAMVAMALCVRFLNVNANRLSVKTAKEATWTIRRDKNPIESRVFGFQRVVSGRMLSGLGKHTRAVPCTTPSRAVHTSEQTEMPEQGRGVSPLGRAVGCSGVGTEMQVEGDGCGI